MKTNLFISSLALPLAATALLLPAALNSCLAQTPTPSVAVPSPVGVSWHKLSVPYSHPNDILKAMHWNNPAQLPEGVLKIYALEGDNSLFIQATTDSFNRLREALVKLYLSPVVVQVKVQYARVPITDVQSSGINFTAYPLLPAESSDQPLIPGPIDPKNDVQIASSDKVTALLDTLKKSTTPIVQLPLLSTSNNVPVFVNILHENVVEVTITPHIQPDKTITYEITPVVGYDLQTPRIGPAPAEQVTLMKTVTNSNPILLAGLDQDAATELLIFITPTLPAEQTQTDESAKN